MFAFCRKALIHCLPTASNRKIWGFISDGLCSLCKCLQTQFHVLSNCTHSLRRYTWRHDSILYTVIQHISSSLPQDYELYADLPQLRLPSPAILFQNQRPDIIIKHGNNYIIIELTCPNESRLILSRDYKVDKYKNLKDNLLYPCDKFELVFFEVSTLGFMSINVGSFRKVLRTLKCDENRVISKCCEVAIRCSFFIYCRRDKSWTDPDILNFV